MGKKRRSPDPVIGGDGDGEDRMVIVFGINPIICNERLFASIETQFRRHLVSGMIVRKESESESYFFLEFNSHFAAEMFRVEYHGKKFSWTTEPLRVHWAHPELCGKEKEEGKEPITCNEKPAKPIWVLNYTQPYYDGNHLVRVDGLEPWFAHFDLRWSIPWAFRRNVDRSYIVHSPEKFMTEGYGFIRFKTHETARRFIQKCNGLPIPGTKMRFQLSWAPFSDPDDHFEVYKDDKYGKPPVHCRRDDSDDGTLADQKNEHSDAPEVEEIQDPNSRIKQSDQEKVNMAFFFMRMNHSVVSLITEKEAEETCPTIYPTMADVIPATDRRDGDDAKILFVDAVNPDTEEQLAQKFQAIGKCSVEVPAGKGCGTVRYESSELAEKAMEELKEKLCVGKFCLLYWAKTISIQPTEEDVFDVDYPDMECASSKYCCDYSRNPDMECASSKYCCDYSRNPLQCRPIDIPLRPLDEDPFVQCFFSYGRCSICGKIPSEEDKGVVAMTMETTEVESNVLAEKFEKMSDDYFEKMLPTRLFRRRISLLSQDLSGIF